MTLNNPSEPVSSFVNGEAKTPTSAGGRVKQRKHVNLQGQAWLIFYLTFKKILDFVTSLPSPPPHLRMRFLLFINSNSLGGCVSGLLHTEQLAELIAGLVLPLDLGVGVRHRDDNLLSWDSYLAGSGVIPFIVTAQPSPWLLPASTSLNLPPKHLRLQAWAPSPPRPARAWPALLGCVAGNSCPQTRLQACRLWGSCPLQSRCCRNQWLTKCRQVNIGIMYGLHFKCIGIRDFTVKTKSMLNLPPPCLTNMGVLSSFLSLRSSRSPLAGRGKMEKEEIIQVLVKNLVLGTGRYSRCQPTVLPKGGVLPWLSLLPLSSPPCL